MKRKAVLITIPVAAALFFFAGCGTRSDSADKNTDPNAPRALPADAPLDANVTPYPLDTCLITGTKIGKMGRPIRTVYKGREFKFCCNDCVKTFNQNPDKYLKKLQTLSEQGDASQKATSPANAGSWTCAMHPDIVLQKPGKCPKCGMALIPKKTAAPDTANDKKN